MHTIFMMQLERGKTSFAGASNYITCNNRSNSVHQALMYIVVACISIKRAYLVCVVNERARIFRMRFYFCIFRSSRNI